MLAVCHQPYVDLVASGGLTEMLKPEGVLFDVKSMIADPSTLPASFHYESL